MSTYYGYRCRSHKPPMESEHWYNHGDYILQAGLLLQGYNLTEYVNTVNHSLPSELEWLAHHPKCDVIVVDEYGRG